MRYCKKCGEKIGFFESEAEGMHYRCYEKKLNEMKMEKEIKKASDLLEKEKEKMIMEAKLKLENESECEPNYMIITKENISIPAETIMSMLNVPEGFHLERLSNEQELVALARYFEKYIGHCGMKIEMFDSGIMKMLFKSAKSSGKGISFKQSYIDKYKIGELVRERMTRRYSNQGDLDATFGDGTTLSSMPESEQIKALALVGAGNIGVIEISLQMSGNHISDFDDFVRKYMEEDVYYIGIHFLKIKKD